MHQEILARSNDEIGTMADAFRGMTKCLGEMAQVAGRITQGQFNGELRARSDRDVMGQAFVGMLAYLQEMAQLAARRGRRIRAPCSAWP